MPSPRPADPAYACAPSAAAAATVNTSTVRLGRFRQAAARSCGTPRLQALDDGAGHARDPQQRLWQQHQDQVLACAQRVAADLNYDHGNRGGSPGDDFGDDFGEGLGGDEQEPTAHGAEHAAVIVTGVARGVDGSTVPVQPHRLQCLVLSDPVGGWLGDDLVTDPLPVPAATDEPAASS